MSFCGRDVGLCIYHLYLWSNLNFLHNSQLITLLTQSCLVLYSFCANMLHSLIMRLVVSFLSPYNLHLLFCCVLSLLAIIYNIFNAKQRHKDQSYQLVLMALFCVTFRRDSVSLLRFTFLSHIHIFSCEMILISSLKHP